MTEATPTPRDEKVVAVPCVLCARVFDGDAPGQAYGNAATVCGDDVWGHYGSTVCDMTILTFPQGRPDTLPETTDDTSLCDDCIKGYLDRGELAPSEKITDPGPMSADESALLDMLSKGNDPV